MINGLEKNERHQTGWSGSIFLWKERGLYLGKAAITHTHAQYAIKVCVAVDGDFRVRLDKEKVWHSCGAAIVAPNQPHQVDGCGKRLALFYLTPESEEATRILIRKLDQPLVKIDPQSLLSVRYRLQQYVETKLNETDAADVFDELVYELAPHSSLYSNMDERVASVLEYLRSTSLDYRISREEIAEAVSLSPDRLSHLFREQSGITIRRYLLWLRLRAAVEEMALKDSLTDIAHTAGFADSAHLSRTFKQMLGLAPSELFQTSEFMLFK